LKDTRERLKKTKREKRGVGVKGGTRKGGWARKGAPQRSGLLKEGRAKKKVDGKKHVKMAIGKKNEERGETLERLDRFFLLGRLVGG